MNILIVNGPNLNLLGQRDAGIYGPTTLEEIEEKTKLKAKELGMKIQFFQSNSEGDLVDCIQSLASKVDGIIINPGALTHYGLSLSEALRDTQIPIIEVHLSNIYSREEWRAKSVIAPVAHGQISGLGWTGYIYALEFLKYHTADTTQ